VQGTQEGAKETDLFVRGKRKKGAGGSMKTRREKGLR